LELGAVRFFGFSAGVFSVDSYSRAGGGGAKAMAAFTDHIIFVSRLYLGMMWYMAQPRLSALAYKQAYVSPAALYCVEWRMSGYNYARGRSAQQATCTQAQSNPKAVRVLPK
jgi:hypothetical protein